MFYGVGRALFVGLQDAVRVRSCSLNTAHTPPHSWRQCMYGQVECGGRCGARAFACTLRGGSSDVCVRADACGRVERQLHAPRRTRCG